MFRQFRAHTAACAVLALATGCGGDGTDTPAPNPDASSATDTTSPGDTTSAGDTAGATTTYAPFQQANLENQLVRVAGFQTIQTLRKAADFSAGHFGSCKDWNPKGTSPTDAKKIASLYVESAELQTKIQGRKDAHAYAKDAPVGLAIDASICSAIDAGAAAGAVARKAVGSIDWHAQVVDKGLQHFFYIAVYGYLVHGTRKGYDEGVGYYGMSLDGKVASGVALTVKSRDDNCSTQYGKDIWAGLLKGRNLLDTALKAAGKTGNDDKLDALTPELVANAADLDAKLLEVFALSMGREMLGIQKGTDASIKLIEGRMFFRILKNRIAEHDKAKGTTYAKDLAALLEQDDAAKADPDKVLAAVKAIWGFDVATLCTK